MLDRQAPDIDVFANRGDHVVLACSQYHPRLKVKYTYHKAAVNTKPQTQAEENKHNRANTIPNRTRPETKGRPKTVKNTKGKRTHKDIEVWEGALHQVSDNHPADGVRVDESDIHAKRNQMVLQDGRLQIQVCRGESPHHKDREKAVQRLDWIQAALRPNAHDVDDTRAGGEEEEDPAVDQIPLREGHLIHPLRDGVRLGDADSLQHGTVPETRTALVGGKGEDRAESEDALDRARDEPQRQNLSVVFIPGLDVESQRS